MSSVEYTHLFENALVKRLSLSPYARNTHKLHIGNLAQAELDKCEIACRIERKTKTVEIQSAMTFSHVRKKLWYIRNTFSVESKACGTECEPCFYCTFYIKTHEIYLIREAIKSWQHFSTLEHHAKLGRSGIWPRCWCCKTAINNINLHSTNRRNIFKKRKLFFEVLI